MNVEHPDDPARTHVNELKSALSQLNVEAVRDMAQTLMVVLGQGGRLLIAGNGGSAAQAQHLSAELTGRFQRERGALSAICLASDTSAITAIGNDYGFDNIFARQVEAHGRKGDILLLLSTSGASPNLLRAAEVAAQMQLSVWAMTGPFPSPLAALCQPLIVIDALQTSTIQECHLVAIHILCAELDKLLEEWPDECDPPYCDSNSLVIIGDSFLDVDYVGSLRQASDIAHHPIVDEAVRDIRPGGAGLAALIARRNKIGRIILITALAPDEAGEQVCNVLRAGGVDVINVGTRGRTGIKTRVIGGTEALVRFDAPHQVVINGELVYRDAAALGSASALVICDYGMGVTEDPHIREFIGQCTGRPIVWDPHIEGSVPVSGVSVVVPSAPEVAALASSGSEPGQLKDDIDNGRCVLREWPVGSVVVTRGHEGALLITDTDSVPLVVPADRPHDGDTCGAGDCFAVFLAANMLKGKLLSEAVESAVYEAGTYVGEGGPALFGSRKRVRSRTDDEPSQARTNRRGNLVVTSGCFDMLHSGHLALLQHARRLGEHLIVCINSDESVRTLKGPSRPIVPARDRASLLKAITGVSEVVEFAESTPERILGELRPDIYVKGADYAVGELPERSLIESWGGCVVVVPYLQGRSTTKLIDRAVARARDGSAGQDAASDQDSDEGHSCCP